MRSLGETVNFPPLNRSPNAVIGWPKVPIGMPPLKAAGERGCLDLDGGNRLDDLSRGGYILSRRFREFVRVVAGKGKEEMAEYSKRLWPSMPTVVRTEPAYLGAKPRYIDAAWAQYVQRKGTPTEYLRRHVADAEQRGLALIVGMNILKGTLGKTSFSAGQLREWGSAMLNSSYPCAFISWTYDANYLGRSDVKEAMDVLANKARTHQSKSCRGGNGQTSGSVPQPVEPPASPEPVEPPASPAPSAPPVLPDPSEAPAPAAEIRLTITQWTASGRDYMRLTWAGATGSLVDIYRNGEMRGSTANDGRHTNSPWSRVGSTYAFKVCETGTSKCSKTVTATFGSQSR